jgi:hypothetical protein
LVCFFLNTDTASTRQIPFIYCLLWTHKMTKKSEHKRGEKVKHF